MGGFVLITSAPGVSFFIHDTWEMRFPHPWHIGDEIFLIPSISRRNSSHPATSGRICFLCLACEWGYFSDSGRIRVETFLIPCTSRALFPADPDARFFSSPAYQEWDSFHPQHSRDWFSHQLHIRDEVFFWSTLYQGWSVFSLVHQRWSCSHPYISGLYFHISSHVGFEFPTHCSSAMIVFCSQPHQILLSPRMLGVSFCIHETSRMRFF